MMRGKWPFMAHSDKKFLSNWLMGLLLLATLILLLAPYLRDFIGDDYIQLWRIREFLVDPYSAYKVLNPYWTNWYYRPLQNLWFLFNRLIFGLLPPGYYFLQIYCHLIAIALMFKIARLLGLNWGTSLGVAALFAINGQHQLTVGWISSIGNVLGTTFTLAATMAYLVFLRTVQHKRYLILTIFFVLMSFLSHELAIALPLFLIALRLIWPESLPTTRSEKVAAVVTVLVIMLYGTIQVTRPNANVLVDNDFFSSILPSLSPYSIAEFASTVLSQWLSARELVFSQTGAVNGPGLIFGSVLLLLFISLVIMWFVRGNLATRASLIWIALQLGFIYFALWSQRPELFNSRHLYAPWAGVCVLVGGQLQSLREFMERNRAAARRQTTIKLGLLILFAAFILFQYRIVRNEQQAMIGHVQLVRKSKQQLMAILPNPTSENRLFATRFILTPPYLPAVASTWYGLSDYLTGGSLAALKNIPIVTSNDYVLDYEDGQLYNLMPEIQMPERTIFLWRDLPVQSYLLYENQHRHLDEEELRLDQIIAVNGRNRFGIIVEPAQDGWASFSYEITVPKDSSLSVGILPVSGQFFRIRIVNEEQESRILFANDPNVGNKEWLDINVPLDLYQGQKAKIYFEFMAGESFERRGLWANPRLTVQSSDEDNN